MEAPASPARKPSLEKEWWLRTLAVFQTPVSTFAALRNDSDEHAAARQEPILALVWLAGIAGVLAFGSTTETLLDPQTTADVFFRPTQLDALEAAVFIFLAGGLYGIASYWLGGAALYLGTRAAGPNASYRRARHIVAYAFAPVALSLFLVWPLRLAVYGEDNFRSGGADGGPDGVVFELTQGAFFAWALALLLIGLRTVHGWSYVRAAGALVLAVLALLALGVAFNLL